MIYKIGNMGIRRKAAVTTGIVLALAGSAWVVAAAESEPLQATTSITELMTRVIQPTSDAVFYVARIPPETEADWRQLENQTLMLAESANLLLIPGYAQAQQQWITDSLLMRDAAVAAYEASRNKDFSALEELNNALYESCESCHEAVRAPR